MACFTPDPITCRSGGGSDGVPESDNIIGLTVEGRGFGPENSRFLRRNPAASGRGAGDCQLDAMPLTTAHAFRRQKQRCHRGLGAGTAASSLTAKLDA
jgi:hypothetical protein